jgi:hypothetical protein
LASYIGKIFKTGYSIGTRNKRERLSFESTIKTGIAIIGLGMASAPHAMGLLDLQDRVEVAPAFSPTPARRQAFSKAYGLPYLRRCRIDLCGCIRASWFVSMTEQTSR